MMPFIRSISELMAITKSKDPRTRLSNNKVLYEPVIDSKKRKMHIRSTEDREIGLPDLPRSTRHKWIRSKKAVSRFFDGLDYNNQIQSTYDLTLIARQSKINDQDAA